MFLAVLLLVASTGPAHSAVITLTPTASTIEVGGFFDLDVAVGGLPENEIVSAFDLDLMFDPTVVSFTGITFGGGFGAPTDYEAGGFDLGGLLDFFLIALGLDDDELFGRQGGGPVLLATLRFIGIGVGESVLQIDEADPFLDVGGRDGLPLEINSFGSARVAVTAVSVPEPASLALLALGLGLMGFRRGVPARR